MNNSMKTLLLVAFLLGLSFRGISQEHQHHTDTSTKKTPDSKAKKSAMKKGAPAKQIPDTSHPMEHSEMEHDSMLMTHAYSRNLPMNRNGSGTAWVPDTSP